ncbi:DUF6319 family protein [Actinoalloteichus caeruleus]|uniref:DUF6319 family protein n=1 Tax=Actinoalloteichus cyanogriseus TaxID=2893586 RepID=UPI001B80BE97|nr:DUF6319 family protein [Actinoalloteichus caeruleus]
MPKVLSQQDLQYLTEELAAGRQPPVWFTSRAVGVEAGKSGKVVGLGDPADGDFIQVTPTGSQDTLTFSTSELTLEKPGRKRKDGKNAAPAAKKPANPPSPTFSAAPGAALPKSPSTSGGSVSEQSSTSQSGSSKAKAGSAKKAKAPTAAVLTLTSTQDGLWTAEVTLGTKKAVKPTTVSPAAVSQAVALLHEDVEAAIEPVLEAAREQHRARVEQLQAELEEARRLLGELTPQPAAAEESEPADGPSDVAPAPEVEAEPAPVAEVAPQPPAEAPEVPAGTPAETAVAESAPEAAASVVAAAPTPEATAAEATGETAPAPTPQPVGASS